MFKMGAVLSVVGIVGSVGGFENGMYGIAGWLMRTAVFFRLMVICHKADEIQTKRKRARRVAARKAQRNNKYQVIYR